jgi:hypothetical protein
MDPCENPGIRNRKNCDFLEAIGVERPYIDRDPITPAGGVDLIIVAIAGVAIAAIFSGGQR